MSQQQARDKLTSSPDMSYSTQQNSDVGNRCPALIGSFFSDRRLHAQWAIRQNLPDVPQTQTSSPTKRCIGKKLAPYGTDGRLLLTANFRHVTQKLGQKSKFRPDKF